MQTSSEMLQVHALPANNFHQITKWEDLQGGQCTNNIQSSFDLSDEIARYAVVPQRKTALKSIQHGGPMSDNNSVMPWIR
jgi:hypothetical protein